MNQFQKIAQEMGDLVTEKNAAYGDSFAVCGEFLRMLYPTGITPDQYTDALCLVRIFDKMKRIATRKDAFGESPYRDIMGYALLGVAKDERAAAVAVDPRLDIMAATVTEAIMGCPSCMDRRACPKEGMRLDKDKRCLSHRPAQAVQSAETCTAYNVQYHSCRGMLLAENHDCSQCPDYKYREHPAAPPVRTAP